MPPTLLRASRSRVSSLGPVSGLGSPEADTLDKMSRFDVLQALKEILEAGTPRKLKGFGLLQSPGYCLEAEKPSKLKRFRLVQGLGESLEAVSRI